MHPTPVVAIVPVKALGQAKGRLAGDLDPATRQALTAWMFERVVTACRAAASVERLLVVAGDDAAAALARSQGVVALLEPRPGLAAALDAADAACAPAAATLVVAADLPLATGTDLDDVCHAAPSGPAVVVAPTRDGGTGALYRRPPGVMATRYGPGSAAAHVDLAASVGIAAVVLDVPGLALDVDDASRLREAAALDVAVSRWARVLD